MNANFVINYAIDQEVWAVTRTIGGSWMAVGPEKISRITLMIEKNKIHESYQTIDSTGEETGRIYSPYNLYTEEAEAKQVAASKTQKGFHKLFGAITFLEKQLDIPKNLLDYIESVRDEVESL